ncbi:MAG: chorismate mutase [Jatrophihabitantaceae bacterium]|nr:chorismate mutase [Jatrophihabitantaceae bacterium]
MSTMSTEQQPASTPPPATTVAGVPADAPSAQAATEAIEVLRGQIDALDIAITRLVAERTQLSRRVQQARISAGGARVELGRERLIMDHYRTVLGSEGPNLAEAILRVGRGAR